jgi:hypothetical protein
MRRRASQRDDPRPATLSTPRAGLRERRGKRPFGLARRVLELLAQGILVGLIGVVVIVLIAPRLSAYVIPESYVYGDSATAALIAWSEHDSQMEGTFHLAAVDLSAQVIRSHTSSLTGIHDGTHITITFTNLQASVTTVDGTLGWRSLKLGLPQSDGQIAAIPLAAGDLTDYDRAVQAIQHAHPGFEIQGD